MGNFKYFHDFLRHFAPTNQLFGELHKRVCALINNLILKYKNDPRSALHAANMKKLLGYMTDLVRKFELAKDCGFTEFTNEVEKIP